MTDRLIENTKQPMRHPWPADVFVQGGGRGLVFDPKGEGSYTTAFVEAFPGATFLRGEGPTLEAAEDACWAQYVVWRDCPHDKGYDRGPYRNGSGHCVLCGTWLNKVLPPLPEDPDPDREPSLLEKAFTGDVGALVTILKAGIDAGLLDDTDDGDCKAVPGADGKE